VAHSSTIETFGYSILEPLLLGKPLVTTRVGVAVEVEKAGKAVVVEPGSGAALTAGLREVMKGGERIGQMTEGGPAWVMENFDTPRVAARLVALYERLIGSR
jgi:glycosyltransferase involved in cell wall biosynthesis